MRRRSSLELRQLGQAFVQAVCTHCRLQLRCQAAKALKRGVFRPNWPLLAAQMVCKGALRNFTLIRLRSSGLHLCSLGSVRHVPFKPWGLIIVLWCRLLTCRGDATLPDRSNQSRRHCETTQPTLWGLQQTLCVCSHCVCINHCRKPDAYVAPIPICFSSLNTVVLPCRHAVLANYVWKSGWCCCCQSLRRPAVSCRSSRLPRRHEQSLRTRSACLQAMH